MRDADIGFLPVAVDSLMLEVDTNCDLVIRELADQSAEEVLDTLSDMHVRRRPVLDSDKNLVGIVSLGDLAAAGQAAAAGETIKGIREGAADPR
jgi:CBS-domain-containing membrane protein